VYSMDTYAQVTRDGGKSFRAVGEPGKHVDNHAFWLDPKNPSHFLMGCDGGLYETWDNAGTWHYKPNLSITQFYRVTVDNSTPFYYVYGGTQDNFSLGGPSRTINDRGIVNSDWFVTQEGDGFESQIDPSNPNIVYAQAQYGWLSRFDRASGEKVPIQPVPAPGVKPYRWNWDAPLLISPHDPATLYFAANVVFKSTNRGNGWSTISPDLSKQIDRNKLPVMGKVWSMDAVAKNQSTSIYGNILSLAESPLKKGWLYAGTDDGLIQVSTNDGGAWTKCETFPGIPANTPVVDLEPSRHNPEVQQPPPRRLQTVCIEIHQQRQNLGEHCSRFAGARKRPHVGRRPRRPQFTFCGYGIWDLLHPGRREILEGPGQRIAHHCRARH
jgi:hypothetical protein